MTGILTAGATAAGPGAHTGPVLELENLSVSYADRHGSHRRVVHNVSLNLAPGEVVALVGESGSGKSTTAQAVIGLLAGNGRIDGGSIRLNGTDIAGWSQKRLEAIRGAKISLIPQDPTSSLNPVTTVGMQVEEVLRLHTRLPKAERRQRVLELLGRVGIPDPERRARQYAHELSGGMKQRVLIAAAIALQPQLIIADEATSALDVTVQRRILDLLDDLRAESGTAVLFVTHDLGVAADRADRTVVLKGGRVQEQGPTAEVLAHPTSSYTRQLIADAPSISDGKARLLPAAGERAASRDTAVAVRNLIQEFATGRNQPAFRAVDGVSFSVPRGTTHAIVGESGSGKTTTARALAGFQRPTAGHIVIGGQDLSELDAKGLRLFRKHVQLVYQNPFTSLDPRQTIARIIEEPLLNFNAGPKPGRDATVRELLNRVSLPESLLAKHPRELSGGQRQRVAIARALVLDPEVLILDEAVSALDVTVQSQILALLGELQCELDLSYVFITHDLAVVRQIADTVSVMSNGRQVEQGTVDDVFLNPQHSYTRELIDAIPGNRKAQP
ncbi:ABC transporter ATP-binding protein [Arthrobacter sp. FW305-BF8]|uniref:dipeptide ABC transporter ATP-binding protein n=1 Tax=Arthrobacter sp. FW305-BF8 TaxID=2879617 RepID=UPI001F2F19DD|nr:ABC transporter ATP-binding protein [Arthrobacter sp. FW305-BF8]UKA53880.1 ABC transporter ATP-binding protein [Arthrobacter sp. FW305-BF8]